MKGNFERVQPWILAHEGGFVDHPKDPGGATNQGITQATYDAWRGLNGLQRQSVRRLSPTEREAIYRTQYWDKVMGDELPAGVDYAVYDFAVNSGPSRAVKAVQRLVGVAEDGVMGVRTLGAIRAHGRPEDLVRRLCLDRMAFLRRLSIWRTFGRGWTRRVMGDQDGVQMTDIGVIDRAVKLARGQESIPAPPIRGDGSGTRATGPGNFWVSILLAIQSIFGGRA